jgi:hypothetical protein
MVEDKGFILLPFKAGHSVSLLAMNWLFMTVKMQFHNSTILRTFDALIKLLPSANSIGARTSALHITYIREKCIKYLTD